MNFKFLLILILFCAACTNTKEEKSASSQTEVDSSEFKIAFDSKKWRLKVQDDYPYRDRMLDSLIRPESLKAMKKLKGKDVLERFGTPDRIDSLHFFYVVKNKRLKFLPLKITTMVIKLDNDSTVQWLKVHNR